MLCWALALYERVLEQHELILNFQVLYAGHSKQVSSLHIELESFH
jgi:hypothetical protein